MAVRLRLKRTGRTNRAHHRIVAMDARVKRDGKTLEDLGSYDPAAPTNDEKAQLKVDRIQYWLSVGAQPTPPVRAILKRAKVPLPPGATGSR
ncbi:MAG: 30S ribosomal protein S16 [Planctomycetota bacterium]